ncbi:MAG: 1-deoxy-D-xylulose-5-phosphate reductoisomerase, partial [Candidatus Aenigmatarchaeota archaeon]
HPQSIVHSMVEFVDNSIIAQLGMHDMRIPIQYALSYPERFENKRLPELSFEKYSKLTFEEPDLEAFPNLKYAMDAARKGGIKPAVLNAANEITVHAFLDDKIEFLDIPRINKNILDKINNIRNPSVEDIFETDKRARKEAKEIVERVE